MTSAPDQPLRPGDSAPTFRLPAIHRDGMLSLEDYRGKSPVMIGLFRGLHCPFCRRHIARLAMMQEKLAQEGVATVAILNTHLERARQYYQYRPTRLDLAADPDVQTHRAFGVFKIDVVPETTDPREIVWPKQCTVTQLMTNSINPDGELGEKMSLMAGTELLNKRDAFEITESDMQIMAAHRTQMTSHFLIDAGGVVRWSHIEAPDNPDQMGRSPGEDEMLEAARSVRP